MERSSKADCWGPARDAETGKGSRQLLAVDGLFCGGCARGLEHRLRKLEGVLDAGVHYLTASAFVHWNPRLCSLREIEACIASAGYRMVERFHLPVVLARLSAATEVLTYRLAIGVFFAVWAVGLHSCYTSAAASRARPPGGSLWRPVPVWFRLLSPVARSSRWAGARSACAATLSIP